MIKWLWDCCGTRATPLETPTLEEFKTSKLKLQQEQVEPYSPSPLLDVNYVPRDRFKTTAIACNHTSELKER